MPMLEREGVGWARSTPFCISTPLGCASFQLKRSPLTPTVVAVVARSFSMSVTRSLPTITPFESTGWSPQTPPGLGAVIRWITTGPWAVNSIRFW